MGVDQQGEAGSYHRAPDRFRKRHSGHQSFLADEKSITLFVNRMVDQKLLVRIALPIES